MREGDERKTVEWLKDAACMCVHECFVHTLSDSMKKAESAKIWKVKDKQKVALLLC